MRVLKIDKVSGGIVRSFETVKDAAADAGIRREQMSRHLKGKRLSPGMFYYRYADDYDPCETFEGRPNRPIAVTDTYTGETAYYGSASDVARKYIVTLSNVSYAIRHDNLVLGQYKMKWAR